ncbi:hypothetical protein CANINC_000463 [Pichia inconspicua]|uniref:BHLH domain-containing protein n=1 Tax=Pichia inconspicua TaxID=52247 RepID=A0A4T0X629_9ASCO|nr:hypothetical protein CANINC_000463 [[Candida] inconspicua]
MPASSFDNELDFDQDFGNTSDSQTIFSDTRKVSLSTTDTRSSLSPASSDSGLLGNATTLPSSSSSSSKNKQNRINVNSNRPSLSSKQGKSSHNMIEKKYRNNINTKFLELKNAVPTLRILDNTSPINFDDLEGLVPAPRLNKANILAKATEYIYHLESKNRFLLKELHLLRMNKANNQILHPLQNNISVPLQRNHNYNQHSYPHPRHHSFPDNLNQPISTNSDYALLYQQLKFQNSVDSHYDSLPSSIPSSPSPESKYGYETEMPFDDTLRHRTHNQTQNEHNENNILNQPQFESNSYNNTHSLANKIMVGGIATLIGSSLASDSSNYKSFGSTPFLFFLDKSLKVIQLITFTSCLYFFVQPLISPIYKWKQNYNKTHSRSLYFTLLFSFLNLILGDRVDNHSNINAVKYSCPIDISSFPMSLHDLLLTYINLSKVDSNHLTNPIEHIFNKIVLLDFILRKFPVLGTLLGFKSKISNLTTQLMNFKDPNNNSKIIKFVNLDSDFINSSAVIDELSKILYSLKRTKSSKKTADDLYGDINYGSGYSSIHEYLYNTPLNKINLFELVSVLWCVDNLRSRMISYLSDTINDINSDDSLILRINEIENFIPISCIKLIKCCMIFQCILQPSNKENLIDTLKMILLNVEENLIKSKSDNQTQVLMDIENLLKLIHSSSSSTLSKVIAVITAEEKYQTSLISDENRLSLVCSIILHQFSVGNYIYARSLIKYLKNDDKSCKFQNLNSITLMSLIATIKTLMVALKFKDLNDANFKETISVSNPSSEADILSNITIYDSELECNSNLDTEILNDDKYDQVLQDLLCSLRVYVGQGCRGDGNLDCCVDYDILNLHYGLQSDLSHKLLELAKEIAGY